MKFADFAKKTANKGVLTFLDAYLLASFIDDNMTAILNSIYSAYMRKLICFYDWKKYGWE